MTSIPERWASLKSATAWNQFRDIIDATMTSLLEEAENEQEALDAIAIVLKSMEVATSVTFDPKATCPRFVRMVSSTCNIGGSNPDGAYDVAVIDGTKSYRIRGNKGTVTYFGFQILGGTGLKPRRHVAYIKDEAIEADVNGDFTLILSADKPSVPGTWLEVAEDSSAIVVRQYSKNLAEEVLATYTIELVDPPATVPNPTDQENSERLIAMAFTARKLSLLHRDLPVLLEKPNQLTTMSAQQAIAADATPDNTYMLGTYRLGPDEALVIDVKPPTTRYWSITIENIWHECLDPVDRCVSYTNGNVVLGQDGGARFVIAHKKCQNESGTINWLDTAGRERGFLLFRWLDTPGDLSEPVVRCMSLDEVLAKA